MVLIAVLMLFGIGLSVRIGALTEPRIAAAGAAIPTNRWHAAVRNEFFENDEQVYATLVDQLDAGKGYTLRGSDILDKPWINHEQYDRALFFHPPGGVLLFWALHLVTADSGLAIAQVLCFCLFFWSTIALAREVIGPMSGVTVGVVAALAAFSPIMSHVAGRFWLDGPVLAFGTAAAAIFFAGWRRKSWLLVIVSGVVFGYTTLIKVPAVLMVPGVAAVAWAIRPQRETAPWRYFAAFVGIAAVMQAPWEFIQWLVVGRPFPEWSGKPAAKLVETNAFVHYLTVVRSPWAYVQLLPQVFWTLPVACLLLAVHWSVNRLRRLGVALVVWISSIVGVHVWLGQFGYSKLLRYVILVTPAVILLFGGMFEELVDRFHEHRDIWGRRAVTVTLVVVAAVSFGMEVVQGLVTTFCDNPRIDVIMPLTGLSGFSR